MLTLIWESCWPVKETSDGQSYISNRQFVLIHAPLIALVFWMGIYPMSFLDIMSVSVANLIDNYQGALAAANGVTLAAQ